MLNVRGLDKSFGIGTENEIKVFDQFNIDFKKNETTAIIGSNGCGKSTLMNLIGGSILPERGTIVLDGIHLESLPEEKRATYIGRVYQDPSSGVSPSLTILENLSLADKKGQKFGLKPLVRRSELDRFKTLLETLDLGLENKVDTEVKYLSGGQRQSLSLLMATMKHPQLLLLDEHTAALDPKTSMVVMRNTLEIISHHDMTTIMITHDMRDAVQYSDRVVMLDRGQIVLDKPTTAIDAQELEAIYQSRIKDIINS